MNKKSPARQRKEAVREPSAAYGGPGGEVALYRAADGKISLEVRLEKETLWLTQKQMAMLFDTERSVITKHLRNIFNSGELNEKSNVQKMHIPGSDKPVAFYNLDVIISVGYRVNSKRGTQFRIWATQVLRDHLLKGYTVNAKRLEELKQAIHVVARVADRRRLSGDEATALLKVVSEYSFALNLLDDYDHGRPPKVTAKPQPTVPVSLEEARRIVTVLRERFGGSPLFGKEKDESLEGSLNAVFQTAGGEELYPSREEKAANLLYFLVKNHHFVDGNKRIGAAIFLWFLEKNGILTGAGGQARISQEALVALTLMIAESDPKERKMMTHLTVALLEEKTKSMGGYDER